MKQKIRQILLLYEYPIRACLCLFVNIPSTNSSQKLPDCTWYTCVKHTYPYIAYCNEYGPSMPYRVTAVRLFFFLLVVATPATSRLKKNSWPSPSFCRCADWKSKTETALALPLYLFRTGSNRLYSALTHPLDYLCLLNSRWIEM